MPLHSSLSADRPDIVWRKRCDCAQRIVEHAWIGAGNHAPARSIPVLNQGLLRLLIHPFVVLVRAHRPHIAGRERGYTIQIVGIVARLRAGNPGPARAVPMLGNPRTTVTTHRPGISI